MVEPAGIPAQGDARLEAQLRRPVQHVGKRAAVKEQNRRVILDAARRVFAELGYSTTTVRDIIRATPLASGTFYNYFRSKEQIFEALRDETALSLRPVLREARLKAETAEAFLAATFRPCFAHVAANRPSAPVKRPQGVHVRIDTPEVLAGFEELHEDVLAAIARGLFPQIDADYLTAAIVGIGFELAEAMQKREMPDPDETARFATQLLLAGIAGAARSREGAG
jgi:AcrR family transcriptional regulator